MVRLLKALPLTLALVALNIVATSCSSNGTADVRLVNAVSNAQAALDVQLNGSTAASSLAFGAVEPAQSGPPAAYLPIQSGLLTIEAFYTGKTTTNPVLPATNATLDGGYDYTLLLAGFADIPAAYLISDNNLAPANNTVQIRVINGSASSTSPLLPQFNGGFDIYLLPPGKPISGIPPITGLTLGQAGPSYITLNYLPQYVVWVTAHNNTQPLFSATYNQTNQQIMTLVIVDTASATPTAPAVSSTMLSFIDHQ